MERSIRTLPAALATLALLTSRPASAQGYTVQDLGTLGGTNSFATAVNATGQVVGTAQTSSGESHAFFWNRGQLIDLGTLGGKESTATGVNDFGLVAGIAQTASGANHAVLWDTKLGLAHDILPVDLGTLGGKESFATAVGFSGQVVGTSQTASGDQHAFLWEKGQMTDLSTLGGKDSFAAGIGFFGQVVGTSRTASGARHAFLWDKGQMTDLGTLGGSESFIRGISKIGRAVGFSLTPGDKAEHAVIWDVPAVGAGPAKLTDLETLGGPINEAFSINSTGLAVGMAQLAGEQLTHAVLWKESHIQDLTRLLPAGSGFILLQANSISDSGQIAGSALHNGATRGFLMTPIR